MLQQTAWCGRCLANSLSWSMYMSVTGEIEDLRSELPGLFSAAGVSMQDIDAVCSEVENLMGDNAGSVIAISLTVDRCLFRVGEDDAIPGMEWACAGITIDEFIESMVFMKSRAHPLDIVGNVIADAGRIIVECHGGA